MQRPWYSGFKYLGFLLLAFVACSNDVATSYINFPITYNLNNIKSYEIYGIDVSHHQGKIDWEKVKLIQDSTQINFVFIRATVGLKKDNLFNYNWVNATKANFTIGAYHYYWANQNSTVQAKNFIQTVKLKKGDLPPVLDVEKLPTKQSYKNWLLGIKNWIHLVQKHYGVLPIIYTSEGFYKHHLKADFYFGNYPRLWIANYNNVSEPSSNWHFWQYSKSAKISGIEKYVDVNVFQSDKNSFNKLLVK